MPASANLSAKELVARFYPSFPAHYCGKVYTDTSEFMAIDHGDVIALENLHYLVLRDECERRFGLEDPKYWVKRCRLLETGERKILKLVFYERFPIKVGDFDVICHRSPEKEARILNLVNGDWRFMQGRPVLDDKRNVVRVLDLVHGKQLDTYIENLKLPHERYFHEHLPELLGKFIGACEAIGFLHSRWEKHGDIRRDHIWVERGTGRFRWIDFDYAFDFHENPFGLDLFGLGTILLYLVGMGVHTVQSVTASHGQDVFDTLTKDDLSLMQGNRIANLRKLFPYVPDPLNHVLLHFSAGTYVFYDSVDEFLDELRAGARLLRQGRY